MGDQVRAQPQHEVKSRWAASTDAADAVHVDPQAQKAAHAASAHQRKTAALDKPAAKAPDAAELKDNAEGQSMQLLDAELLDVARELYKSEPAMREVANTIIALRSDSSAAEIELDKDKRNEADEVAINIESDDDKRKHRKLQSNLRGTMREKTADKESQMAVEKLNVEHVLAPAFGQFQTVMAKATSHGLHGKGIERGTSYLRQVLERYTTLTLWMGIESPLLEQMKTELTKLTNHLNIATAKDVKIEKLARVDDEHAAHDKAWLAICAVQGQANLAKGVHEPHDVINAVALMQSHLSDAIEFVRDLAPDSRKQLKHPAADIVAEAKAVDQIALSSHLNQPSLEAIAVTLLHALSR